MLLFFFTSTYLSWNLLPTFLRDQKYTRNSLPGREFFIKSIGKMQNLLHTYIMYGTCCTRIYVCIRVQHFPPGITSTLFCAKPSWAEIFPHLPSLKGGKYTISNKWEPESSQCHELVQEDSNLDQRLNDRNVFQGIKSRESERVNISIHVIPLIICEQELCSCHLKTNYIWRVNFYGKLMPWFLKMCTFSFNHCKRIREWNWSGRDGKRDSEDRDRTE